MRKTIFFIFLILSFQLAYSQVYVSGRVVDGKGKPVFAADIYFSQSPTTGGLTDMDGNFKIEQKKAPDTLTITFMGYKTRKIPLNKKENKNLGEIVLKEDTHILDEIVVNSENPISEKFSVIKLKKIEIYLNPVSQGDALKAVTLMPSSTTIDESASPSLRGSRADLSRVMLNGVPIYHPVRNSQINGIGNFSLFNTEIIGKQYVYSSNPPLTYGNSSAGLIEINTNSKINQNQIQLSTSLANLGVFINQKIKTKTFVQIYSNKQFSNGYISINKNNLPNLKKFASTDIGLNFHSDITKKLQFNSFTYAIKENFTATEHAFAYSGDLTSADQRIFSVNNLALNLRKWSFRINSGVNLSNGEFTFGNMYAKPQTKQLYHSLNVKWHFLESSDLQFGISNDYQENKSTDSIPLFFYATAPDNPNIYADTTMSLKSTEWYYYYTWNINPHFIFTSGIRGSIPNLSEDKYGSSQMGLRIRFNEKNSLLFSGGKYHSYTTPNYQYFKFSPIESAQLAIDYSYKTNKTFFTLASYLKIEAGKQPVNRYLVADTVKIFGVELYFEKLWNKFFKTTFSNTYMNQELTINDKNYQMYPEWNYLTKIAFEFMKPKLFNATLSAVAYNGKYYNPVKSAFFDAQNNIYQPVFDTELFTGKFNDYFRLDFNINKYIPLKKNAIVLFLSINNILNTKNQKNEYYNTDYSQKKYDYYQLRSIYFGIVFHLNH